MILDSFAAVRPLPNMSDVVYVSLPEAEAHGAGPLHTLPRSTRALAENLLRHEDGRVVTADHVQALTERAIGTPIPIHPARLLMQDASGIPVLADMVTLGDRARETGLNPAAVSPTRRMDLVVDHSLSLDFAATKRAAEQNLDAEYRRHAERYRFLRWTQDRFPGLRVIPPGIGICHQLNLEVLADVVMVEDGPDHRMAGLDSVLGTDSHTTMVNSLSVLGWGVGGIEATVAALGQPIVIPVPPVVGVRITGQLRPGVLAADVALTLTARLRGHGVVGKIVEFYGPALSQLSVPDRATVANMAPEYGATMAYFPADGHTIDYLIKTGRPRHTTDLVRTYLSAQDLLHTDGEPVPLFDESIDFDLSQVARTIAGPTRPHEAREPADLPATVSPPIHTARPDDAIDNGDVVIAAITSCTNTSNYRAMVTAGLLARNAVSRGLRTAPWTKTSLTPGSRSVATLLTDSDLQRYLDVLGFQVAGFGCGTCMGNAGELSQDIADQIRRGDLRAAAVLSGNRNFPGRIHPNVSHAYLVSPPLVIAFAIAGTVRLDLDSQPIGKDRTGADVFLADIWPVQNEIDDVLAAHESRALAANAILALTTQRWLELPHPTGSDYEWADETGTIRRPPFAALDHPSGLVDGKITGARALLVLGDEVTTDHISPVAPIRGDSEAARWLIDRGATLSELGTYSSRRLNHDVMLRGGFDNLRLHNRLAAGTHGAVTTLIPDGAVLPVHEAASIYAARRIPVIIVAGHSYGAGSARDWAAKVTRLLGVQAVLARSFERIHRTNLVAMGVIPIECPMLADVEIDGTESFDIVASIDYPPIDAIITVRSEHGVTRTLPARPRIDTAIEAAWISCGGVMPYLLQQAR